MFALFPKHVAIASLLTVALSASPRLLRAQDYPFPRVIRRDYMMPVCQPQTTYMPPVVYQSGFPQVPVTYYSPIVSTDSTPGYQVTQQQAEYGAPWQLQATPYTTDRPVFIGGDPRLGTGSQTMPATTSPYYAPRTTSAPTPAEDVSFKEAIREQLELQRAQLQLQRQYLQQALESQAISIDRKLEDLRRQIDSVKNR
jgi:hypothetical protein